MANVKKVPKKLSKAALHYSNINFLFIFQLIIGRMSEKMAKTMTTEIMS